MLVTLATYFAVPSSCKGTITQSVPQKVRLQNQEDYKFITLRPLMVTSQGLQVIYSIDP